MTYRVLIIDDERLARERLRDLLAELDDVSVAGECASGEAAIAAAIASPPDMVFLDVQMPGSDGFDVLAALDKTIDAAAMPIVIFVTAFDAYAIRAFEASAMDYLQKPVSRSRLAKAVARGRQQLELREAARAAARSDKGARAATEGTTADRYVTRFAVRRGGIARFVRSDEIDWIDSAGNYVRLHVRGTTYMLRCTIGGIETRLDPRHFARIHRSAIVNLDRVAKLERFAHGEHVVVVSDGTRLRSSRAHSARLRTFLRSGIA